VFVRLGAFLAVLPAMSGDGEEEGAEEEESCEEGHDRPLEGTADHPCPGGVGSSCGCSNSSGCVVNTGACAESALKVNDDGSQEGDEDRCGEEDVDGSMAERPSGLYVRTAKAHDDPNETEEDGEEQQEVEEASSVEDVGESVEGSLRVDDSSTIVQEVVRGEEDGEEAEVVQDSVGDGE